MERLEIISVVLIGLGALLIANPVFLGLQSAPGTVVVQADQIEPGAGFEAVNGSSNVLWNPNVTRFEELSPREQTLVTEVRNGSGAARMTREGYREVFRNASSLAYLRPDGYLLIDGTLTRPRFSRGQQGGLTFTIRPIQRLVIGELASFDDATTAVAQRAMDGPVPLDAAARTVAVYDFVVTDGNAYAPTVANGSNRTVALTAVDRSAVFDGVAVSDEELPPLRRRQAARAIEDGSYDTGNASVGPLRQVSLLRTDDGYYRLSFETAPPSIVESLQTIHIVGVALGLLFLLSGLYYVREIARRKKRPPA
jgi:hypothetical protein